jgi:acetyl-CoA carboxylase biotin carboxyl carrier protein
VPIDFNQLREFIEAISKTEISELTIREGDFELTIQKQAPTTITSAETVTSILPPQVVETTTPSSVEAKPASITETVPSSSRAKPDNWREIASPMVGTFYRAPAPGEPAFVEVGDKIAVGQVVCIIEAMKLMNEIEAEISGKVMEIAVENGEPVEYGQTLLWIAPS